MSEISPTSAQTHTTADAERATYTSTLTCTHTHAHTNKHISIWQQWQQHTIHQTTRRIALMRMRAVDKQLEDLIPRSISPGLGHYVPLLMMPVVIAHNSKKEEKKKTYSIPTVCTVL